MSVLYVHIGTPKTATSSIQEFMEMNREVLKKNGISYPYMDLPFKKNKYKGHRNGNFLVHNGFGYEEDDKEDVKNKIYAKGLKIIKKEAKRYNKIVVSDEAIWYRQNNADNFWGNLKEELAASHIELKVIVYLRRQDLYVEAWWNQAVKYYPRSKRTFAGYLKSDALKIHNLDYYAKLREIADVLGMENVIVKVFDKSIFISSEDAIYQSFLNAIVEEMKEEYVLPGRFINDKLKGNFLEIKRMINRVPEYRNMDDFMKRPAVFASNMIKEEKVSYFSHEEKLKFLAQFEESNKRTAEEFLKKENGILFEGEVEELPKWEVNQETMLRDVIYLFTENAAEQERKIIELRERVEELERQNRNRPLSIVKRIFNRIKRIFVK